MYSNNAQVEFMAKRAMEDFDTHGTVRIFKGSQPKWAASKLMAYVKQQDPQGAQFEEWAWQEGAS